MDVTDDLRLYASHERMVRAPRGGKDGALSRQDADAPLRASATVVNASGVYGYGCVWV